MKYMIYFFGMIIWAILSFSIPLWIIGETWAWKNIVIWTAGGVYMVGIDVLDKLVLKE